MTSPIPFRSRAAAWLALPATALIVLYARVGYPSSDIGGYWTGVVSTATLFTVFSCSFGALAGALDGSRLRRSRTFVTAPGRSALSITFASIWPTLLIAFALQAVGLLMVVGYAWGAPGRFPWEVTIAWVAMITFHTAMGFVLGLVFPAYAAAPAALLLSYVWLGYTWSVDYFPLRYLSGLAISGCCVVYTDLAPEAVPAVVLFCLMSILGTVLALSFTANPRRSVRLLSLAAPIMLIAIGAFTGLAVAANLEAYPASLRLEGDLICNSSARTEICFFPEQLAGAPAPGPVVVLSKAVSRLNEAGVPTPDRIVGSIDPSNGGALTMVYRHDFDEPTILHSFSASYGYNAQTQECGRDAKNPDAYFLMSESVAGLVYHYASGGGSDPYSAPETEAAVKRIVALPKQAQLAWLQQAQDAIQSCFAPMPRSPD